MPRQPKAAIAPTRTGFRPEKLERAHRPLLGWLISLRNLSGPPRVEIYDDDVRVVVP